MEIIKLISLFSLISLSLCASFSGNPSKLKNPRADAKTSIIHKASRTHKYDVSKQTNGSNKSLKQCFCYIQKQTGIPITHILNSDSKGMERLVMHVYKDITTGEIKVFLPNNEKQIMIPDLMFDEGDHLEISPSETVHHIFNQFPDLISKRERIELPDIKPIIVPDIINKKINISTIYTPTSKNQTEIQDINLILPTLDTNINNNKAKETTIKLDVDVNPGIIIGETTTHIVNPSSNTNNIMEIEAEELNVNVDSTPVQEIIETTPDIFKQYEHSIQIPLNIKENVVKDEYEWTLNPVKYINKKITNERHVNPQEISIIAMHPESVKKYQDIKEIDLHNTFDSWFNNQMKRAQFTNSKVLKLLDIYTFKYLVEKTLSEKGIHITKEGLIIDSKGNILQTSNLRLRPILIGNSVEYKNLLQGKVNAFKLPTNLPYLEAVLITSINPPKILGIIPLGKTFLPEMYQRALSWYVGQKGSPKNICGGRCNQQHEVVMPSLTAKQATGDHMGVSGYKVVQPENSNVQYSRRIFPFDQVNTLIDKIYKIPISDDFVNLPQRYVVNTQPVIPTRPIIKYPVTVTQVAPGFRIIGGNAATSSGTPLNNKGRSGSDFLETKIDSAETEI